MTQDLGWLKSHLEKLENELLLGETRRSAQRIGELLSPDFFEFSSLGKVYRYCPGDTFPAFPDDIRVQIENFHIKPLSDNCVLATYVCNKHDETNDIDSRSLRCSVWQKTGGAWKIVFHQGTPCF
jgi:hypothetical protein